MGRAVTAILIAFAVVLAVIVGFRMSAEAMAVVVGVVCGVAAAIPMSVLILLIMNRRNSQETELYAGGRHGAYPPVVVIQGGQVQPQNPPLLGGGVGTPMEQEVAARTFRVLGHEE